MASGLENIETIESPFRRFVTTIGVFPTAFTDAMTYYECLAYLVKYLEDTVVPAVNDNAEALQELQDYVAHYFDNLNVQEEINKKLDQMAEDGSLTELISSYANEELMPLITSQNTEISSFKETVNGELDSMSDRISQLADGSPLVASSTSEMTDTTRIYVNTTDGKWYYYDGDSWEIGGTYQSTELANGSVTLDKLASDITFNLNDRINNKEVVYINGTNTINFNGNLLNKNTGNNGSIGPDSTIRVITDKLYYMPFNSYLTVTKNTNTYSIEVYCFDKDFTFIASSTALFTSMALNGKYFIPNNTKYIRFKFSKSNNTINTSEIVSNVTITLNKYVDSAKNTISGNLINEEECIDGYIGSASSPYSVVYADTFFTTPLIKVSKNVTYKIKNFRKLALYDLKHNFITGSFVDTNTNNYTLIPSQDCFVKISYLKTNSPNYMSEGSTLKNEAHIEFMPDYIQPTSNVLAGKKYVALGDSFTEGAFQDSPTEDYYITEGKYAGKYKVYPYLIGNRNDMEVVNLARGGMTVAQVDETWTNYLSDTILESIPNDADYITVKLGINDNPDHENSPLGTIDSTDSSTFYGSWNRIMTYLITNHPTAKIGMIISNGQSDINYVNAEIAIAEKYGIPYLNESTDPQVPLLNRTLRTDIASFVRGIRNNTFSVNNTGPNYNTHPNATAHQYESTFVEQYMRSL